MTKLPRLSAGQLTLLLATLVVGGGLRSYGLTWGLSGHYGRAEAEVAGYASSLVDNLAARRGIGPDGSAGRVLPLTLALLGAPAVRFVGGLAGADIDASDSVVIAARAISVLADLGSILLIFQLGRFAGIAAGLWSAALYASALIAVRQAHFATPDSLATFFVLLYVYSCSLILREPVRKRYTLAGVALGLVLSVDLLGALLVFVALVAFWLEVKAAMVSGGDYRPFVMKRYARYLRIALVSIAFVSVLPVAVWSLAGSTIQGMAKASLTAHVGEGRVMSHSPDFWAAQIASVYQGGLIILGIGALLGVCGALVAVIGITHHRGPRASYETYVRLPRLGSLATGCFVCFLVMNPNSVFRPAEFWVPAGPGYLTWELLASSGVVTPTPGWLLQFEGTWPGWFHLRHIAPYAWGPPLAVLLIVGLIWALLAVVRREAGTLWAVATATVILCAGVMGLWVKETRHMLQLTAVLCVCAGFVLAVWGRRTPSGTPHIAGASLGGLVVASSLALCIAYLSIYSRPDTRTQALHWLRGHATGIRQLCYEWDDSWTPAFEQELRSIFRDGMVRYNPTTLTLEAQTGARNGDLKAEKEVYLEDVLRSADTLVITEENVSRVSRLPEQFPVMAGFYRRLFAGEAGLQHVVTFRSQPQLLGWTLDDSNAELSLRTYDHPTIHVFRKAAIGGRQKQREPGGDSSP